ncbi:MAG: hypothetical protein JSU81_10555, partial [Candidatus Coatesbacteria bacterium]
MPWRRLPILPAAVCLALLLAASCARKAEWPPANEQDRGDTIYVAATTADGAEVIAVSASGEVRRLGLRCDDQSGVALAPDGR